MSTDAGTLVLVALRAHVQSLHEAVEAVEADRAGAASGLRDAAGRTASLLASFRPALEPERTDPVRDDLVRLADLAGGLRDAEAVSELIADLLAGVSRALVVGPVGDRIRHHRAERGRQAADALAKAVRDEWCVAVLRAADRLVITPPLTEGAGKKAGPLLARCARADDERLGAVLAEVRGATGAGERERLWPVVRAEATALAGSAAAARDEHGKKARRLAEAAEDVAGRADELTDTVLARRMLVDLADLAHRHREPGFTYGLLHAEAARRGAQARERLEEALEELGGGKLRSWLREG